LAIVVGLSAAALAFRLVPPLSPAFRTHRLLELTFWELRRLTTHPAPGTPNDWKSRIYSRLSVLPEQSQPLQRARLLAMLCVGTEIIRLRHIVPLFDAPLDLDAALKAVADGNIAVATARLALLDGQLTELPSTPKPGPHIRLQARASIMALGEALGRHPDYFDKGPVR
jgi:hypothetical protein